MIARHALLGLLRLIYDDANSFVPDNVDWDEFFSIISDEKLAAVIATNKHLLLNIPNEYIEKIEMAQINNQDRMLHLLGELKKIKLFADERGIGILLIKGFSTAEILYADPFCRIFYDLDIIIDEASMSQFFPFFEKEGYRQYGVSYLTGEEEEIALTETKWCSWFHEYQYVKAVDKHKLYVELKKSSSAVLYKTMKAFVHHKVLHEICGLPIDILDVEHTCLHLIANAYRECINTSNSSKCLRNFVEIMQFIAKFCPVLESEARAPRCDFAKLTTYLNEYSMHDDFYFVSRILAQLFPENAALASFTANVTFRKNVWLEQLLCKIESNVIDYFFCESYRIRLAQNFWRDFFISNNTCNLQNFRDTGILYSGTLYDNMFQFCIQQSDTHLVFKMQIPEYKKHIDMQRIAMRFVDGFIDAPEFLHYFSLSIDEIACSMYYSGEASIFSLCSNIIGTTMCVDITISKENYVKYINPHNRIVFNVLVDQVLRPGFDIGIFALVEVSAGEHNLESLPCVFFDYQKDDTSDE